MKILVACEESQAVTKEFRALGHEAYSCDIVECSGGHPEWHIMGDVLPLLNGDCEFQTMDGTHHEQWQRWDMIIAFPPCTHLAVSGAAWFEKKRADGRQRDAINLFMSFINADCDKIAVENPVNIISGNYIEKWFPDLSAKYNLPIKPTQHIQPYEHGDPSRKKTALWLKGLPNINPTNIVEPELEFYTKKNGRITSFSKGFSSGFKSSDRSTVRSKTFHGIARAMADQWGGKL